MRVFVEEDMTVCPDGQLLVLRAGDIVDGPAARWLVATGCAVTVEEDDPAPAAVEQDPAEPDDGQEPESLPLSAQVSQDSTAALAGEPEADLADEIA